MTKQRVCQTIAFFTANAAMPPPSGRKGMAKLCLQVNSEEELLDYHERALRHGLKSFLITDSGRTEFGGTPTRTACAIGPASVGQVDAVTGDLTLY